MQHTNSRGTGTFNQDLPIFAKITKFDKASRKPISRNLCGFLNTGLVGTVYCGIVDTGEIMGLKLSEYQMDHIVGAVNDLMTRYNPPVEQDRYKIRFVPVLGAFSTPEGRDQMMNFDPKTTEERRRMPHKFRTPHYCWCDTDMMAQDRHGVLVSDYIIEITILPWDPDSNTGGLGELLNLHPIHADEEGKIYFRR